MFHELVVRVFLTLGDQFDDTPPGAWQSRPWVNADRMWAYVRRSHTRSRRHLLTFPSHSYTICV